MATLKQIQANRRNSLKSTGPRTPAGKAASSMNAVKSGIHAESQVIRGEDPEALAALKTSYYDSLQPTSPEEAALVDAIIAADWQLRRLRKAEADIWNREFDRQDARAERCDQDEEQFRLAAAFEFSQSVFMRIQRRLDAAERSLHRSLAELRRLRNQPTPDPSSADSPGPQPLIPRLLSNPQIGFVPSPRPQTSTAGPIAHPPLPQTPTPAANPLSATPLSRFRHAAKPVPPPPLSRFRHARLYIRVKIVVARIFPPVLRPS